MAVAGGALFTIVVTCALGAPSRAPAANDALDLELVLAVDASGSVNDDEFRLQMSGIATAFRDPAVLAAIREGPAGRIAVTVALWSESNLPKAALAWHVVGDAASAERFARQVEGFPRRVAAGGTGIGKGVMYALDLLRNNGLGADRQVIDVSGDGVETGFRDYTVPISQARQAADILGVTINGLAILTDDPDLESYYRAQVITGPGAFALSVDRYEDFAAAMRIKLVREIENRPIVSQRPPRPPDPG